MTSGILRFFESDKKAVLYPNDAQPDEDFFWSCAFVTDGRTLTFKGALTAPKLGCIRLVADMCHRMGLESVRWERWENGKKRFKSFSVDKFNRKRLRLVKGD